MQSLIRSCYHRLLLCIAWMKRTDVVVVCNQTTGKISLHMIRSPEWNPFVTTNNKLIKINGTLKILNANGTITGYHVIPYTVGKPKNHSLITHRWMYLSTSKQVMMKLRGEDE